MSLLQSLILKSFKKIYNTKFKVYYMCITIFTSCFDIPEFSKNKKNHTFFSNSIQYVNGISEFQKKLCISRDDRDGSFWT